jgi:hypothetical protein
MQLRAIIAAVFFLVGTGFAGTIQPSTTLTAETSNNTSAVDSFPSQSNGNLAAGNVSKVPTRTLLYNGSTAAIYAHFMGWFGDGQHMDVGYTSSDPNQVSRQVSDALSRGISGFILDWYGNNPKEAVTNNTAWALKSEAESRNGAFVFAIDYDGGALYGCANTSGCDLTRQAISDLTYAYNNFETSPAYMKANGRPLVFFFAPDRYGTLDWARISASVPGNPLFLFLDGEGFAHASSGGSYAWVHNSTDRNAWGQWSLDDFYLTARNYPTKLVVGATFKGFNDTLADWTGGRIMNQNCGQTWLNTFNEIGKYYSSANQLEALQIVTWNDYEEGTEVESGLDNCVTVSGAASGTVVSWGISGSETMLDHYTVFISRDGENLMRVADVPVGTHTLDLAPYNFDPAAYTVYVKAVGRPSFRNRMSAGISYGVTPAPAADFTITATPASQSVARKSTTTYTVTVSPVNGFTGTVNLGLSGLSGSALASFNPATVVGGAGSSQLSVTVGNGRGKYTLTITGTYGNLSHSTSVLLSVAR